MCAYRTSSRRVCHRWNQSLVAESVDKEWNGVPLCDNHTGLETGRKHTFIMSETLFTYFHCMPLFCFIYLFVLNRVTCLYQLASSNLSIDFLRYKVLEQQTGSSFIIRQIPLVMTHVHNSPI